MTESTNNPYSAQSRQETINNVNETLAKLAGGSLKVSELFRDRKDGKSYIEKPPTMTIEDVVMQGTRIIEANAQMVSFTKKFKARPNDGAVAFAEVISQTYGFGAVGKAIHSFFGTQLPEYKTVTTGVLPDGRPEQVEVPWGLMEFAPLEAQFNLHYDMDVDYGFCFTVAVTAPKKKQTAINGLFMLVEEYLSRNSIYRGKALFGVGRASRQTGEIVEPDFINVYKTDRTKIVYAADVQLALNKNILARIEHSEVCRRDGVNLGAKVLLWGDNGTGKTEFTNIAGQVALENGWGIIRARYDEDIAKVVAFAERLGTPTIVVVEDVEKLMEEGNSKEMDKLLDLFDGAGSKGREVMLLLTSNHIDELTKSMTRAGRIDRMIHVGSLDKDGVEKLVNVTIPQDRREELDFEQLHDAYDGYAPVWILESLKGLRLAAIARTGEPGAKFATEDFVSEAKELRVAWEHHLQSTDRPAKDRLGVVFEELITDVVDARLVMHRVDVHDTGDVFVKVDE